MSLVLLSLFYFGFTDGKLPVLHKSIEKEGFHREIVSTLTLSPALFTEVDIDGSVQCFAMFTEVIPAGAYIDPDQIKSLKPHGGVDVSLTDTIDIEKPEFESTTLQAHVFTNLSKYGGDWMCTYRLPIHLRYHAVSKQEYINVTFTNPEIAVRCFNHKIGMTHYGYHGETVKLKQEICSSDSVLLCGWVVIQYHTEKNDISIEVPIGKEEHLVLVTITTVLSTLAGCLYLVYFTLRTETTVKVS